MKKYYLIILGLALTVILIGVTIWVGAQKICDPEVAEICDTNFAIFMQSPPNEKGDALAGVASSLAFLWIIITVLLQSSELALQRQELAQTRHTLEKQTSFLASQESERIRLSIDSLIETKIDTLGKLMHEPSFDAFDAISKNDDKFLRRHMSWITDKKRSLGISNEELIKSLNTFIKNVRLLRKKGIYLVRPNLKNWEEVSSITQEILVLLEDATPAMQDRVERIENIKELNKSIIQALSPQVWALPESDINS